MDYLINPHHNPYLGSLIGADQTWIANFVSRLQELKHDWELVNGTVLRSRKGWTKHTNDCDCDDEFFCPLTALYYARFGGVVSVWDWPKIAKEVVEGEATGMMVVRAADNNTYDDLLSGFEHALRFEFIDKLINGANNA